MTTNVTGDVDHVVPRLVLVEQGLGGRGGKLAKSFGVEPMVKPTLEKLAEG